METPKRSLDVTNAEHIGYKYGGIEITVLGGIRLEGLDRLRVTLKVRAATTERTIRIPSLPAIFIISFSFS